jgi:hypothetical protein
VCPRSAVFLQLLGFVRIYSVHKDDLQTQIQIILPDARGWPISSLFKGNGTN